MHLIARSSILRYIEDFPTARGELLAWAALVEEAEWNNPGEIQAQLPQASTLTGPQGDTRVVFRFGLRYRLICGVRFNASAPGGQLFVKWFGTHEEYNAIDPATVTRRV